MIKSNIYSKFTLNFGSELNCPVYSWDDELINNEIIQDKNAYKCYTEKFTKHPSSPNLLSYKILLNSIL